MNTLKRAIKRRWQILFSAYPWLIREESRNLAFWRVQPPRFTPPRRQDSWLIFSLPTRNLYWPSEFDFQTLPGLYKEVFTPWQKNPHAYVIPHTVPLRPGDWVLDAGACEGFFCLYALQQGANVLALEPIPRLAQALEQTFASEIQTGRLRVLCAGLGEKSGQAALQISPAEAYNSSLRPLPAPAVGDSVPLFSVDDLLSQGFLPRLDFLKMDIEGFEVAAMRGAMQTLRNQKPRFSLAVYHHEANARLIQTLVREAHLPYRLWQHGVFLRQGQGPARPFMLHGAPRL